MRLLYRKGYENRYKEVLQWIPSGSSVFEACAGDCRLYLRYLKPLGVPYRAGDFNPRFVAYGKARGVDLSLMDLRLDPVPEADVVVMQASLYQFLPDATPVLARLARSARKRLILIEPIKNLASSANPLIAWLGRAGAATRAQGHTSRFTDESLLTLVTSTFGSKVIHSQLIAGEKERLFCVSTET